MQRGNGQTGRNAMITAGGTVFFGSNNFAHMVIIVLLLAHIVIDVVFLVFSGYFVFVTAFDLPTDYWMNAP